MARGWAAQARGAGAPHLPYRVAPQWPREDGQASMDVSCTRWLRAPLLRSPPSLSWWEAGGVSSLGMCPLCAPSPAERTSPTLRQAHRLLFTQEPPPQSGHRWSKWVAKERSTSPEPARSPAPSTASGSAGCCQDACPGRLQKASWDSPAGQSLQHRPRF